MTLRDDKGRFLKGKNIKDLSGSRFGKLLVIGIDEDRVTGGRKTYWVCKCDCGKEKSIRSDSLTSKRLPKTESCGCLRLEKSKVNLKKNHSHKSSKTRLYHTWQGMKSRCYLKNSGCYERYGGRGIIVCEDWKNDFSTFKQWALSSGYNDNLTIERIDFNGNYEPSNCTWIPLPEQSNNRRSSIFIEYQGQTMNLKQWSDKLGIKYGTLNSRYKRGYRELKDLFAPVVKK